MKFQSTLTPLLICTMAYSISQIAAHADPAPRKIAIIASGYYDVDAPALKGATDDESDKTKSLLEKKSYQTTWIRHEGIGSASTKLLAALTSLEKQLDDGKLKRNDQVLLYLLAHGGPKTPYLDGHKVEFGERDNLALQDFAPILQKLSNSGVKVAFIDRSCYSGNSIDLAKTGACVISVQSRYNVGREDGGRSNGKYGFEAEGFASHLRKALELKPTSNLEEAFLTARQKFIWAGLQPKRNTKGFWDFVKSLSYSNDLPEISSAENERLRPIWERLFFTNLARDWDNNYNFLACSKLEDSPQDLRRAVDLAVKAAFEDDSTSYDRFLELHLKRADWLTELAKVDQSRANSVLWDEIYAMNRRRNALIDQLQKTEDEYQRLLGKVMLAERRLYTELYRDLQKSGLPSNPCREFNL